MIGAKPQEISFLSWARSLQHHGVEDSKKTVLTRSDVGFHRGVESTKFDAKRQFLRITHKNA